MNNPVITVVGATGTLGGHIVEALLGRGAHVRAMVRATSDRTRLEALGVTDFVVADLNNAASLQNLMALEPVAAAVVASAAGFTGHSARTKGDNSRADTDGYRSLVDAAQKAGVPRFILISILECDKASGVPHFYQKYETERYHGGSVDAPRQVLDYWSELPEELIAGMEEALESGRLEMYGLRNSISCRGAIEVGLCGKLDPPLSEDYRAALGPFAGNMGVSHAHRDLPESLFRIEQSYDWEPSEDATDALSYGLSGAIADIAEICATETRELGALRRKEILREGSDASFIELLRSARRQTFERCLDTWWVGFEHVLRNPWPESGRIPKAG